MSGQSESLALDRPTECPGPCCVPTMAPGAPGADASPRQGGRPATRTLWTLFLAHRWRILVTYALFNAENLLWLVQPLALGLAITDLGRGSGRGLAWLGAVHLAYLLVGSARQASDTRTYTRITSDLACRLVVAQRGGGVEVARRVRRCRASWWISSSVTWPSWSRPAIRWPARS